VQTCPEIVLEIVLGLQSGMSSRFAAETSTWIVPSDVLEMPLSTDLEHVAREPLIVVVPAMAQPETIPSAPVVLLNLQSIVQDCVMEQKLRIKISLLLAVVSKKIWIVADTALEEGQTTQTTLVAFPLKLTVVDTALEEGRMIPTTLVAFPLRLTVVDTALEEGQTTRITLVASLLRLTVVDTAMEQGRMIPTTLVAFLLKWTVVDTAWEEERTIPITLVAFLLRWTVFHSVMDTKYLITPR